MPVAMPVLPTWPLSLRIPRATSHLGCESPTSDGFKSSSEATWPSSFCGRETRRGLEKKGTKVLEPSSTQPRREVLENTTGEVLSFRRQAMCTCVQGYCAVSSVGYIGKAERP